MSQTTTKARWSSSGVSTDFNVDQEVLIDVGVGKIRITQSGYILDFPEGTKVGIFRGFRPGKALKNQPDETVVIPKGGGWKMSRGSAVVFSFSTGTLGVSWSW